MSLAVVRCPGCRGPSRVAVDAIGQMVACPRCDAPFVAVEEAQVVSPGPRAPAAERPVSARPVAPRRRRPPPEERDEPQPPPEPAEPVHDPEHDPHHVPTKLPVSVNVGLALLPFGIPLLWLVTPLLTGQKAALSLAVPVSLAVAAAALCLGVVKTIDWTAATRIKGVFMLVGLSYLSAAGLYFLKKDLMDQAQGVFSPTKDWEPAKPDKDSTIRMPPTRDEAKTQPLPGVKMAGVQAGQQIEFQGDYHYLALSGKPATPPDKPDEWFAKVREHLEGSFGKAVKERTLKHRERPEFPGREWTFQTKRGNVHNVRIVQVYVIDGRVYYLSAEGPNLDREEDLAAVFFGTFLVN
jgi:hypothetical protein